MARHFKIKPRGDWKRFLYTVSQRPPVWWVSYAGWINRAAAAEAGQ
jgi:hypothetical protein